MSGLMYLDNMRVWFIDVIIVGLLFMVMILAYLIYEWAMCFTYDYN